MATTRQLEASKHSSRPIEYYHFYRTTQDWYYTTSKRVKTLDGIPHFPLEITRGTIDAGGQDRPGALQLTLPTQSDLGQVLQSGTLPTPVSLRITRQQPDASDAPSILFIGELATADIEGAIVTVQALPFMAQLDLTVPQGLYQRDFCAFITYDPVTCKVDPAVFTFIGTVSTIAGLAVTVTGAGAFDPGTGVRDDMFAKGTLTKGEGRGMIDQQIGDVVMLLERLPGLVVGDTVSLLAGDDRRTTTCHEKFLNSLRRLAFDKMPVINPFYGQGLRQ